MIFLTKPSNSIRISSNINLTSAFAYCTVCNAHNFMSVIFYFSYGFVFNYLSLNFIVTYTFTDWLTSKTSPLSLPSDVIQIPILTFRPFYEDLQQTGFVFWPFSSWCYIIQHPCVQAVNRAVQCSGECPKALSSVTMRSTSNMVLTSHLDVLDFFKFIER